MRTNRLSDQMMMRLAYKVGAAREWENLAHVYQTEGRVADAVRCFGNAEILRNQAQRIVNQKP